MRFARARYHRNHASRSGSLSGKHSETGRRTALGFVRQFRKGTTACQGAEIPLVDAKVCDGPVVVQIMRRKTTLTFEEYVETVFVPYLTTQLQTAEHLDILWDTNLLRGVQNIHWSTNATLKEAYGQLSPLSVRLRFVAEPGGEPTSLLLLWSPRYQPVKTRKLAFPEIISRDTGIVIQDLQNKNVWHAVVRGVSAEAVG